MKKTKFNNFIGKYNIEQKYLHQINGGFSKAEADKAWESSGCFNAASQRICTDATSLEGQGDTSYSMSYDGVAFPKLGQC